MTGVGKMKTTIEQLKTQCISKYRELWGNDWVEARYSSIGASVSPVENGLFEFDIDQSDSLLESRKNTEIRFSHIPPQHSTRFKCNLNDGTIEVVEHR